MQKEAKNIFSYRQYWAKRFGVAPVLPMSRAEMDGLGWDSCDIIIVTGDAYVDHPSFGMAGRDFGLALSPSRTGPQPGISWRWANRICFLA